VVFGCLPGVVLTAVGYAGGTTERPSYYKYHHSVFIPTMCGHHRMGDHTECVRVTYDPQKTKYQDILDVFWRSHDSTVKTSRQYRSILIPNSDAQTELAIAGLSSAPPASKTVVLEGGGMFTVAEQRHQKNRLRRDPAMVRCLVQSGQDDLTSSYLATRLNGFLGGKGTMGQFNKEWQGLGLSKDQAAHVRRAIIKRS